MPYLLYGIFRACLLGNVRPYPLSPVMPGIPGKVCDLRRPVSVACCIEGVEILKFIRADNSLCTLGRLVSGAARYQFGAYLRCKDAFETGRYIGAEELPVRNPSDDVLDQCFGYTRIDIIVRHVIPHAVGTPSKRQFAQITCAHHHRMALVSNPEQNRCALTGLNIFKGDIIEFLPGCIGVIDILHHLHA